MTNKKLINEALTGSVIGAFYEVHNTLGYGFYEHFYTRALEIELGLRGHNVAREVRFPVVYKTHCLGTQRVDMVVDGRLIVESKSTQELHRGAPRQLFSYLHGSTFEIGFANQSDVRASDGSACSGAIEPASAGIRSFNPCILASLPALRAL